MSFVCVNTPWFPILIGAIFFIIIRQGGAASKNLEKLAAECSGELATLIDEFEEQELVRVPGTADFLTGRVEDCPTTLRHHVQRNKTLRKQVILLTMLSEDVAKVSQDDRF